MTTSSSGEALILVTVGTDHHPFDRLVRWIDGWLERSAPPAVRCLVQHGTSPPSERAESHDYLPYDRLRDAMERARAVVCHGGPATIMDARYAGRLPIVVPRDPERGEHVDGHQLAFARRLARAGDVLLAEDAAMLAEHLDRTIREPATLHVPDLDGSLETTVRRFDVLLEELIVDSPPRFGSRSRS